MEDSLWTVLALLILLTTAGGLLCYVLVVRLRRHHRAIWDRLGRPRVLLALSPRSSPLVGDFIWKGGHRDVGDFWVRSVVIGLRVVTVTTLAIFALGVCLVFLARRQVG